MKPIVILGPTATGKTDLAVLLARRWRGRIISADSVQVYRGLDIGSCKPSPGIRQEIPHEGIDVADPREPFSAGRFARLAGEAIARAGREGEVPIVAGGTGLYIRALLCGIAPMPPRDATVRERLRASAEREAPGALHDRLAGLDPDAAARIGRNDLQRIVRALEVIELTGMPFSAHIRRRAFQPDLVPALKVGLTLDRAALYRRVDRRVERLFRDGLVEEVQGLLSSGVPGDSNAMKALGYREVVAHLKGEADLATTMEAVKRNTRRYARRQIIWFRREPEVTWFDVDGREERSPGAQLERIADRVASLREG